VGKKAVSSATKINGGIAVDLNRLLRVCRKHVLPADHSTVVPEPYLPYIPPSWNGVLVTAEAQNLSRRNVAYRTWLLQQDAKGRMRRLYDYDRIGVAPWTDGTLQIAVEAALGVKAEQTAISNAVPWSLVTAGGANLNPSSDLIRLASVFWSELLPVLKPKMLLVCGAIGRKVFDSVRELASQAYYIAQPSKNLLSRISGMFGEDDLLARYPEVADVVRRCPHHLATYRRNKIFYACHVVSTVRSARLSP
jgi:hypothetical protein